MSTFKLYQAICAHPICPGEGLEHCTPHAFDEENCDHHDCAYLDGCTTCEIVQTEMECTAPSCTLCNGKEQVCIL